MQERTHSQIAIDAKDVVNDPARFADQPAKRLFAWAILMGQRGNRVNQLRLALMQRGEIRPRSHAIEIADARFGHKLSGGASL